MNPTTLGPVIGAGLLPVSLIDDKVRPHPAWCDLLRILGSPTASPSIPLDTSYSENVALQIAREGVVLLKNGNNLLAVGPPG